MKAWYTCIANTNLVLRNIRICSKIGRFMQHMWIAVNNLPSKLCKDIFIHEKYHCHRLSVFQCLNDFLHTRQDSSSLHCFFSALSTSSGCKWQSSPIHCQHSKLHVNPMNKNASLLRYGSWNVVQNTSN